MKKVNPSKVRNQEKSPVAEVHQDISPLAQVSEALPRPARRRRKQKHDRGLPEDSELVRMAEAYLERQHKHFPEAAACGVLLAASPEVIREMVDDFKRRHRGGAVDPKKVQQQLKSLKIAKAGGAYPRYSCENSNPTSVIDQLMNCLDKAAAEERFVPWAYVYADYAVTGLDASRQGYSSLKKVLSNSEQLIDTVYIDDFTRASRDEIEWWRLARLVRRLRKRMIGASDGFDLVSQHWEVMLTLFCLLSRLFVKSLREKVKRGMKGAASRFSCLGKLALGFTRRQKQDKSGNLLVGADGLPVYEPCIDPATCESRRLMYHLYVEQGYSCTRIAKQFNQTKVENWDGWTAKAIRQLLWSPTAIGVFIWNMTRREYDDEEERWEVVKNPCSEWVVYRAPDLALIPLTQWKAARRKLAAARRNSPLTNRPWSRNALHPSTLFSGTLFCACCEHNELKLVRSVGKFQQIGSIDGMHGVHGCQLSSSKSVKVIEKRLLEYLKDELLTPERVTELVTQANQVLEEEAQQPIPKTASAKKKIASNKQKIDRLVRQVSETDDDSVADHYHAEIKRLSTETRDLQTQVAAAGAAERRQIQRLDKQSALTMLADLHTVLNEDIALAGPAIRELTGPIRVRQEVIPGTIDRFRWIANFTPQIVGLLGKLSTVECASFAAGKMPASESIELVLDKLPRYEQLAFQFQRLRDGGASVAAIASAHKISEAGVVAGLKFAETGERPKSKPKRKKKGIGAPRTRYKEIASEVVRLLEEEQLKIPQVAERLGVGVRTVGRAYDYARPEAVLQAIEAGRRTKRRIPKRLDHTVFETIRQMNAAGASIKEITRAANCSANTVRRELARLAEESESKPAA